MNREMGRKGEEEKGACTNDQGFQFLNASNLCHVQINYSGRNHNFYSSYIKDNIQGSVYRLHRLRLT